MASTKTSESMKVRGFHFSKSTRKATDFKTLRENYKEIIQVTSKKQISFFGKLNTTIGFCILEWALSNSAPIPPPPPKMFLT